MIIKLRIRNIFRTIWQMMPTYITVFILWWIKNDNVSEIKSSIDKFFDLFLIMPMVLLGVIPVIYAIIGGYEKQIKEFCKRFSDSEKKLEEIKSFYNEVIPERGIRLSNEYIMSEKSYRKKGKSIIKSSCIADIQDIIWVYKKPVYIRLEKKKKIPSGYEIGAGTKYGECIAAKFGLLEEEEADKLEERIIRFVPDAVYGYSIVTEDDFENNIEKIIAEVDKKRELQEDS